MKNYIKPTFTLAGIAPVALAGTNCTIKQKEYKDLYDLYGVTPEEAFAMGEDCQVGLPLEGVCKITMADNGTAVTIIGS